MTIPTHSALNDIFHPYEYEPIRFPPHIGQPLQLGQRYRPTYWLYFNNQKAKTDHKPTDNMPLYKNTPQGTAERGYRLRPKVATSFCVRPKIRGFRFAKNDVDLRSNDVVP